MKYIIIPLSPTYYIDKIVFRYYDIRPFFTKDFYRKKNNLSIIYSDFSVWFSKKYTCRYKGHDYKYWMLIDNYKCNRCFEAKIKPPDPFVRFRRDKHYYDKLQTPWWKLTGQAPKAKDIALERYLKRRGMSYGDWKRERDYYQAKNPGVYAQMMAASQGEPNATQYQKN